MELDLEKIRSEINLIDDKLVGLYKERLSLCDMVAEYKKHTGKAVLDRSREERIIARLTANSEQSERSAISGLYKKIFEISRTRQVDKIAALSPFFSDIAARQHNAASLDFPKNPVVACQGVEGAYSSIACNAMFKTPPAVYVENFENVFECVSSGACRYGVLPFENSIYGSVSEVYEMLSRFDGYVVRSVKLPIHHALLAKPGTSFSDIREVYSHRQAIGQCSVFLGQNKQIKAKVCENTAAAAKMVAESSRTDIAAVCSEACAKKYGLTILKRDLQNNALNYTMFYCISKEPEIYPEITKTAFMFNIKNESGSLADVLSRFSAAEINLTKIESRPIPGKDFEFMFYAEADIDYLSQKVLSLFSQLESELDFFKFIGAYTEIRTE